MMSTEDKTNKTPDLWEIFTVFLRIGFFTFGGGLVMAAVIRHELTSKNWITDEEFVDSFSIATAFPGVIAVNTSLVVGNKVRGTSGALVAMTGAVLPSFITIFLIAFFFLKYFNNPAITLFFRGAGAAVTGILAYTAFEMGKTILKNWWHICLCLSGVFLGLYFQMNPLFIIFLSALVGYIMCSRSSKDDVTNC
jgi:chromate transporter